MVGDKTTVAGTRKIYNEAGLTVPRLNFTDFTL